MKKQPSNNLLWLKFITIIITKPKGVNLALFCKTTLEMTDDNICFIGGNGTQFVYCVYQNTNSNKFTFFLKDLNMPKTIRNIIKSVVGE